MESIVDEVTLECLAILVDRKLSCTGVLDILTGLFNLRGVPGYRRSDNGPDSIANAVRDWIAAVGAKVAFIEAGNLGRRFLRSSLHVAS